MKLSRRALVAAPLALGACGGFGSAITSHTDVVAKAAGKELRVEDAAQILAANPQIPADPRVVRALADLWVDYTLLATAAAEDSTLSVLDLDQFVESQREEMTVYRYLESRVTPDTAFDDAALAQLWVTEGPGAEIKARHVLLQPPAEATPAQRDSLRQLAEQIRQQAAGGADFAALAQQYTTEPGGKERGGDLGWFGRGRMVQPFEEAAFALQPGQVSPVVETPFGYHVIKVEDRRQEPLGDRGPQFRQQLVGQRRQQAVTAFLDSLKASSSVEVQPGAADALKELAAQENLNPRGRAASRALVSYRGGELTAGEVAKTLQNFNAQDIEGLQQATAEQVDPFLENEALKEVLLAEARARNFRLGAATVDSIRDDARAAIRELLSMAGLSGRTYPRGDARSGAIQEIVRNLLEQAVSGQRQLAPLGRLGFALRNAYGADVNTKAFQSVVTRMEAVRAAQPQPPAAPQGMPQGMPEGAMPPGAMPQQQPQAAEPAAP